MRFNSFCLLLFSYGEQTAVISTTLLLVDKRQRYGLLQGVEWRRDSNMAYCRVLNGEETAIWPTEVFRIEKR